MYSRPAFRRCFVVQIVDDEGVFLLDEGSTYVLRGRAYLALAPLLDGRLTEDELCRQLEGRVPPAEVAYALAVLKEKGLISDGAPDLPRHQVAFWEAFGVDAAQAEQRLQGARITVSSLTEGEDVALLEALHEAGLGTGPDGDLLVISTDDYLHPKLAALNKARLADGRPWLLLRSTGVDALVGPLIVPGKTACWRCMAQRLEGHCLVERYLEIRTGQRTAHASATAALPSTRRVHAGLAATAIARWVVQGGLPSLEGRIVTINAAAAETRSHVVCRRPQCSDCGDPGLVARRQREPVVLEPTPRMFTADGGHRQATPEETFARLAHHVSPVTGIVRRLTRIEPAGTDPRIVNTYITEHNFVHLIQSLSLLRLSMRSYSGGKGRSDAQAKASALCESIERYSAAYQGDEARVRASLCQLGGDGIHPNDCMGYSDRQYAEREIWNRHGEFFCWVPVPFDPASTIDWSPVWSLTHGRRRYVPTAYCYYGYPFGEAPVFTRADSNGCAAGNSRTEAILQGLLELFERDAVAMWWYNRLRLPAVDIASFGDPYLTETVEHWRSLGRELWALDLTNDLGIPTFVAVSRSLAGPREAPVIGFGAHLDPHIALLRAITEHNQVIPAALEASVSSERSLLVDWLEGATVAREPYLMPAPGAAPRRRADFSVEALGDLRDDVERCVDLLRRKDLDVLVLDQTRPDTGLAVVKVIVPGLRHFWARFGAGRLYDVPVALGLREAPLSEAALNPFPMFI
ncbi:TOMM precursor leader peptide-binding protein [Sorangium sp. So ce1335]|uniref:TOMM precursor leader peptide-binding protein n=1 Tax=Sorangium sp. So ce1335 TaxID=3133335 RepID=UPI003F642A06